ncbi:MAG: bacillithiol biosynthesis cysteine-adding enzyme BshC [Bacteroidetes bacterium OLB11]|nr:MAG: bacillithiol biosynthesis cysteine-adding enzyme BshC [Bacteroidetes bacterium OLB11]
MTQFKKESFDFETTGYFSKLAIDIVHENDNIKKYIQAFPSDENIQKQVEIKSKQFIDRTLLCDVLNEQYSQITLSTEVKSNIESLKNQNTFTICTAHQPCIFTGPIYFIYKIAHAIKIAQYCNQHFPQYHFVPIFYMGTEDNDMEEIGTVKVYQKTYQWVPKEKGASGRINTDDLIYVKQQILSLLDLNKVDEKWLYEIIDNAYQNNTLSKATRILTNALFEKFGLLIIDADEPRLKKMFSEVIKSELLFQKSFQLIQKSNQNLEKDYSIQAKGREINLFYLNENLRERIEKKGDTWVVKNTNLKFDELQLLQILELHPETFSPNVILRPLYQEMILPNVLFLGGGGELAYWSELKPIFEYYKIAYPIIQLRNSFLLIDQHTQLKMRKSNFKIDDFFEKIEDKIKDDIKNSTSIEQLKNEFQTLENAFSNIEILASEISSPLQQSMKAHHAKFERIKKRINEKILCSSQAKSF